MGKVRFLLGGEVGVGRGILEFLAKKVVALPLPGTKEKHLTLPTTYPRQK